MHRQAKSFILLLIVLALIAGILIACTPVEKPDTDPYPIVNDENNQKYLDTTTKDEAIDRAVGSMENLLEHLDTDEVSDSGYYIGADMTINTEDGSAFVLHLQANLYTYPYELKDENGNVLTDENGVPLADPVALAHHNDIIRYSDIILEWFDGASNEMLIGFYFDGINKNSPDPGNDLYLDLQGSKRIFRDFGDSVLYQQLIRVITQFNLETLIGSASDGTAGTSFQNLRDALQLAVTDNYKQTLNGEETTIFFSALNLTTLASTITEYMQSIFQPFEDKLDPLTNKYLGFLFSTLGVAEFSTINSDMEFIMANNENLGKEIMNQLVMDVSGDSSVPRVNEQTGLTIQETVPYTAHISAEYDVRTSSNIVFDKAGYTEYVYGSYEYTGDMYIPMLDLKCDVLLRTDFNETDNTTNKIFMNCRDLATDDLLIGLYYKNETVTGKDGSTANDEFTFIDIEGLEDLYGGVKFEDIGLPKAYRGGFDLADTLAWLFDFIDEYIVIAVDNILYGQTSEEESSQYEKLTSLIMDNMESTMKDEDDPSSRATIKIKIDVELIRQLLSATSETGTEYTTEQMIMLINRQFNIDIESLASIFGVSVQELLDETYFEITYDVDSYAIRIDVYTTAEMSQEEIDELGAQLLLRLDLEPQHVGEKVKIVFPNFSKFNELEDVMTYSGELTGEFTFASTEDVFLGDLFGAFMGDVRKISGSDEVLSDRNRSVPYNTPYTLPKSARIKFELVYDQYIREQILDNGRWTRTSRSAFILKFDVVTEGSDKSENILNIYANDVSFSTANPVEELGYVWLDYPTLPDVPKFKVREDVFLTSFYRYMGYDFESEDSDLTFGLTDIVKALMEDSWAVFEPDVIRITTSNETIRNFFNVDEMIATAAAKIGFKQRVYGIDSLESDYAMYTVGELEDIDGESIYSTKLHDTVKIYFDFGTRVEVRDFYFLYNDASVEPENGALHYRPAMRELFMGVNRDYLVTIGSDAGRYSIDNFESSRQDWEPLDEIPDTVSAYYGGTGLLAEYDALYNLHAVYDAKTGYYTVLNNYGYEIVYDFENNVYIVGLGTASKYDEDKLDEILNPSVPWYKREINSTVGNTEEGATFANLKCLYDLGMRIKGWYVVENNQYNILYSPDKNVFIVDSQATLDALNAENYFGSGDVVYTRTIQATGGQTFVYDLETGYYCSEVAGEGVGVRYKVLYNRAKNYYYVANRDLYDIVGEIIKESRISVDSGVNSDIDWDADYDYGGENYNNVDWSDAMWSGFEWTDMSWDDITLEGGLFVVKVVVGDGMMATYWENVVVKIINRTVVTDKYVNIETPDGTVLAPVADTIQVDPYVYLIYKAYYENTYSATLTATEKAKGFVNWFFSKYTVTFEFTKIYNNEEDTDPEAGSFSWSFDDDTNNRAIYKESQINNRHAQNEDGSIPSQYTYVYTVFEGQVIALGVEVLPRILDAVYIEGETEANTYTVDALESSTYTIPTNLTYIFRYWDWENDCAKQVALNFKDYTAGYGEGENAIPSIFSVLPELPGYEIAGSDSRALISWANPVADNVKLVNTDKDGNVHPFKNKDANTTSSFFGIKRYLDFTGKWYYEDWFRDEEIVITVNAPDKVIGEREYVYIKDEAHNEQTTTVQNIQIKSYYTEGQTEVGDDWGVFYVDPFDSTTWILPDEIYAHFSKTDENGIVIGYTPYLYTVVWRTAADDNVVRFDNATGKYVIKNVSEIPDGFFLYADIGEGDNTMAVRILVRNLSAYMDKVEFLNEKGELVSKNYNQKEDVVGSVTGSGASRYTYQLDTYTYYVDTYARFTIPAYANITFKDGTVRKYAVDWDKNHDAWVQATSVEINATLGDAYAIRHPVYLTVKIQGKALNTLTVVRADEAISAIKSANAGSDPQIEVHVDTKKIAVNGIPLTNEGLIDLGEQLGKMTPYEFFDWLFADIELTFYSDSVSGTSFANIKVTDAVDSARLPIFATLDTQKLIEEYTNAYGQGIDIYIGQDKGAHDFTVEMELIGNDYVDFDDEQPTTVATINIEAFNGDNTEKYPEGYVLADNLNFYVTRKDGTRVYYSNTNGDKSVPAVWAVACPTEEINKEFWDDDYKDKRMAELTQYEQLTVIDRERLLFGGEIWLTAMLEDSSRVYVHISCVSVEIGDNFYSADDDTSPYKIEQGIITIENIYDNYKLGSFLTPANLPSKIKIGSASSDIVKTNITWKLVDGVREKLDTIDYKGTNGKIALATATIVGKEVTLYVNVLPCEVVGLKYDTVKDREFTSEVKDENGVITINVDAYKHWAYAGRFTLPTTLKLVYGDSGRGNASSDEYSYGPLTYYRADTDAEIKEIPYNLSGHTLADVEDPRNIDLKCTLKDGQTLQIRIHIQDKTITYVNEKDSVYKIDPYWDDDQIGVPSEITIYFKEGDPLKYTAEWTADEQFEVKFDTYQRLLKDKKDENGKSYPYFKFTAPLTGYSGMADQQIVLNVYIHDRLQETYTLVSDGKQKQDSYTSYVNKEAPNAYHQYKDPFAGKATDLPSTFKSQNSDFPIIWDFTDEDIEIGGTYKTRTVNGVTTYEIDYITVYGHVANKDRGQPIAIRVYVDSWEYQQIRKPDGAGGYIVMEGDALRFIISAITGVSAETNYQVDFSVVTANIDGEGNATAEVTHAQRLFVPEGVDPAKIGENSDYPYRLYWDTEAVNRAKSGNETTGYYAFGTESGEIKARYSSARYQYERPNILTIDMGYGFGTEQNVVYVVNPLNPNFNDVEVKATGTYSGQYNVSLTDAGLKVVAKWGVNGKTPDVSAYFAGGVIRNQTVTLEMTKDDDSSFYYTQSFNVMLVMLDMSPTSYINNRSASTLTSARFKTVYNASTYAGSANPYKDVYVDYLVGKIVDRDGVKANVLDTAIRDLGLEDRTYTYVVTEWEDRVYNSNNTKTQYSSIVKVNGREYRTNSVVRRWNSMFEITGLKLGYGGDYVGIDSAEYDQKKANGTLTDEKKIVKVVNPLDPSFGESYSTDRYVTRLSSSAIVGTYDGKDITSLGYTFSITWWDVTTGGNTVMFGESAVTGGILDYWKIKVSVYENGSVVYEQIMNIELVLLDLTPESYVFYSESDSVVTNKHGVTSYTSSTYKNRENPYGDEYTDFLMLALNNGVKEANVESTLYTYRVTEWGEYQEEPIIVDGEEYEVRYSKYVEIEAPDGTKTTVATDMFQTRLSA